MPPVTDGRWNGILQTPGDSRTTGDNAGVFPVHGLLLKNGNVLLWSGHVETSHYLTESYEWDPTQPISTAIKTVFPSGVDIFCCHHALLDDGRVITIGGAAATHGTGIRDICVYDPGTHAWTKIGDLSEPRWYPTMVALPDGSYVVFSGRGSSGTVISSTTELLRPPFTGPGYTTTVLAGADKTFATYPGMHLVPGGKVVYSGTTWRYESGQPAPINTFSFVKTGANSGAWIDEGLMPNVPNREEGTSVLLPPAQDGKILLVGGGFPVSQNAGTGHRAGSELDAAEILDTQSGAFTWHRITDMNLPRVNPNAVLLPDGKVLVHGGHNSYKWTPGLTSSNQAEIYDPVLDTWTLVDTMHASRQYHSTSILLPDGKVFTAGGVDPSQSEPVVGGTLNQKTFELYEPAYFFNGTRPTITAIRRDDGPATEISYGGQFLIDTPDAATIIRVVIMRTGSMTHHTDTEQRYVPLDFVPDGSGTLRVGVTGDASIAPPGIYMIWIIGAGNLPCQRASFINLSKKSCYIITDRSHVSNDEVVPASPTTFDDSFYVVMDGFLPAELGIPLPVPSNITPFAPNIEFRKADHTLITQITAEPQALLTEVTPPTAGVRQRFTFKYRLRFANNQPFFQPDMITPIELQDVHIHAASSGYTAHGRIVLTHQPNPYMLDGDTHWLSTDLRVFQVTEGGTKFGQPAIGNSETSAISFLQNVLTSLNATPASGASQFNSELDPGQDASKLELSRSRSGQRVFNFAIAKVRYRGRSLNAANVRAFFRMFMSTSPSVAFNSTTTYRRANNTAGDPIPLLGLSGGEILTIPFFAQARVNTAVESMLLQQDTANTRTINHAAGSETYAFFGCLLDFNQTALRFPLHPGSNGPYSSGLKSIQELVRGRHQCLVTEIHFASDPINEGETPGSNDNLAQRNLAIVESDNPGGPATRTVQHTIEIKASEQMGVNNGFRMPYFALPHAGDTPPPDHHQRREMVLITNDELIIEWKNLPRNSKATLYIPAIKAEDIIKMSRLRPGPEVLEWVDEHTISCAVNEITYVPLPPGRTFNLAALLSIELPVDVYKGEKRTVNGKVVYEKGQRFNVTFKQVEGMKRKILGAFELVIPVSSAELLLENEMQDYAVFKHIFRSIPPDNRWYPVFERYLQHTGARVNGFGGNAAIIEASPDGISGQTGIIIPPQSLCCRLKNALWVLAAIILLLLAIGLISGVGINRTIAIILGLLSLLMAAGIIWLTRLKCFCNRQD